MAGQKKVPKSKSKPSSNNTPWLQGKRLYAILVFAFSFALYFNTIFNDYNLDDELVTQNHQVTSKGWNVLKLNFDAFNSVELKDSSFIQKLRYFLPVVFRVPYYQDKAGFKYEYRPMVFASFALEHALFSKKELVNGNETETNSAAVSHFINILLYSVLCTFLFFALCTLFKNYSLIFPFIVSVLFAAYPMHTEVVASIKNRDEILALIFGLLSLQFSLKYIEKKRLSSLILVLLFFGAGILSKPTIIIFALIIPLCIVFFTNAGYLRLLLLASILILPSVFYSRLYSAVQQITLGLILFSAISIFYVLKNRTSLWVRIKQAFKGSYGYFMAAGGNKNTGVKDLDFGFLKNPVTVAFLLLPVIVPTAISAFGICIFNSWLACIPLLCSGLLFVFVSDELKVILITPLSLVAMFALVTFAPESRLIETGLIVFLSIQIFSDRKSFRITGLINYMIYSAVTILFLHSFHFLFIILFVGIRNRKLLIVSIIVIAFSVFLFLKSSFGWYHGTGRWFDGFMFIPVLYVFVFLLWKQRWRIANSAAAILIPMFLIICFVWIHPGANNSAYYAVQKIYYNVYSAKAIDPTPVQSVRPLKYLEYPLSNTDPVSLKTGTDMEVLGHYLKMILIPYPMSFYYGYSYITPQNIYQPLPLISLLVHIMLLGIALYFFRKIPLLSFSILFYLISIAVFSNLVTPIPGMLGDRFLLIPSIGFCIFILFLFSLIFKQDFEDNKLRLISLKQPLKISLAVVLVLYSGLTFSRNMVWKDRLTLFRHDIYVVENSAQAHNLLAVHLFLISSQEKDPVLQKQLREEAIPHFKRALEIYPDFLNASYDLGRTYEALHLNDEALVQYRNTVKLDTTFVAPYFNMGAILHNKGQYAAAIPMYQKFLTQYPKQSEAYANLSFAYFKLNDFESSIATNRLAIQVTGSPFFPTVNIAKTFMVMNQPDSALFYYEQAHALQPNDAGVNSSIEHLKAQMH